MIMQPIELLFEYLIQPRNIVVTTHTNPDADALGSSLGLFHFLRLDGHSVTIITPTDYPSFLHWMPGQSEVVKYQKENHSEIEIKFNAADIIFCLDFNSLSRINELGNLASLSPAKKVLIDHHTDPEPFADFQFWTTSAAATAELIYDFIVLQGKFEKINLDIAECLYAGVMTDTGSFRHPSTTSKVHRMVAQLIDLGINVNKVSRLIYDNNSLNRLRFLGHAFLNELKVNEKAGVGYFVISKEEYEKFNLKTGDTEGLVNYALSITGIVMAATIIERENEVKLSFRSISSYAVNSFASQYFNGGGHKNAAGGISHENLETTVKRFENLLSEYKKKYILI